MYELFKKNERGERVEWSKCKEKYGLKRAEENQVEEMLVKGNIHA